MIAPIPSTAATRIVRRVKMKDTLRDASNKGSTFLIQGRGPLTRGGAITLLQESEGEASL